METNAPETRSNEVELSVIIPHYNCVDGVLKLLETIPDLPWIEVIVVDDRSTCDISQLKDYVSKRGGQVRLFTNDRPAKGPGTAKNIGLENACGKWVLYADSDDYFTDNWTDAVSDYLESDADIIYFPPTSINIETGKLGARHRHYEELVKAYASKPTAKAENELKFGFYATVSKMIKMRLWRENEIRFEEQRVADDVMALTKCAYYSKKIAADNRTIYCITCGGKSLTTTMGSERFDTLVDTKIRRYVFLRDHLSSKVFNQTHADYYMAGSLADAVLGKRGMHKFAEVLKKYRKNGVKWLTIYMFEPSFLFRYILLDFKWRLETNA